jgi:hypothetical protein
MFIYRQQIGALAGKCTVLFDIPPFFFVPMGQLIYRLLRGIFSPVIAFVVSAEFLQCLFSFFYLFDQREPLPLGGIVEDDDRRRPN